MFVQVTILVSPSGEPYKGSWSTDLVWIFFGRNQRKTLRQIKRIWCPNTLYVPVPPP